MVAAGGDGAGCISSERFGTDFNQADQLFFDQIVEAAVDDELHQTAAVNPEGKFELVFKNLIERLFVERMDQNEEIFVRYMNDQPFRQVVSEWMASEAYRRLRSGKPDSLDPETLPSDSGFGDLQIVEGRPEERYATCVSLVPLAIAAGAFGDPQYVEDDNWEWVTIDSGQRLRPGMFVARIIGRSMEPAIPDGAYCLFAAPVASARNSKTVLVQLRDAIDPETGERYTVKRYKSKKTQDGNSWPHTTITLEPLNLDFLPIVLTSAEFVDVVASHPVSSGGG